MSIPTIKIWLGGLLLFLLLAPVAQADEGFSPKKLEFFENRIRPLLVNHCQSCHGSEKSESDFRVDSRHAVLKGGASEQPGAVPSDAEHSLLLSVVSYSGDYDMPPKGKLSDQEIADLNRWVTEGMAWPTEEPQAAEQSIEDRIADQKANHWSLQPIKSPDVPQVSGVKYTSPIDAFLTEKLIENGLTFSPPADKATLIRRATFDLTGLPPTYQEVQSFVADDDERAYEKLIDRLLASPRYGQRWARHWLDVARYADTVGYAFSNISRDYPFAYTYRDYVIDAFNKDLPYNEFVRQQIAADQLTDDRHDRSLAALGFLTAGRKYIERPDIVDDRIDVVMRGFMGLTVGCARCHDHKFDGVSTEDYYSLYGVFENCFLPEDLPMIGTPPKSADKFIAKLDQLNAEIEAAREEATRTTRAHVFEHIEQYAAAAILDDTEDQLRAEGVITLATDLFRGDLRVSLKDYWRSLPNSDLVKQALADLDQAKSFADRVNIAKRFAAAISDAVDVWTKADRPKQPLDLFADGAKLRPAAELVFQPDSPPQWKYAELRAFITRKDLLNLRKLKAAVTAHNNTSPRGFDRAMILQDRYQIEEPYVMIRGNVDRRGKTVSRKFPQLVSFGDSKNYTHGAGRLELANDIVNPDNPLTARVIVNRIWMHHFIEPLVATPSDFGVQGQRPTHRRLLDWLAADFMASGWSIKSLHRKMMLSDAYRQSSRRNPIGQSQDPENDLLWRMNRRRLEIEALRDSILSVAGTLNESMSGRGVRQFEPPFDRRRTIYGLIDRQKLAAELRMFDLASPDQSAARRTRTYVPQQSLFLMNSPLVGQHAEALARKIKGLVKEEGKNPETADVVFVTRMFQQTLSRDPTAGERNAMVKFIRSADDKRHQRACHLMLMTNEFEIVD